jgi:hypothetical protein
MSYTLHLFLEFISDKTERFGDSGQVRFMLTLNDVALLRSCGDRVTTVGEEILESLMVGAYHGICWRIVRQIKESLEKRKFGEPLTLEYDDFWGFRFVFQKWTNYFEGLAKRLCLLRNCL